MVQDDAFWGSLLTITKCDPKGRWIKNMFQVQDGAEDGSKEGVKVNFHKTTADGGGLDPQDLPVGDLERLRPQDSSTPL